MNKKYMIIVTAIFYLLSLGSFMMASRYPFLTPLAFMAMGMALLVTGFSLDDKRKIKGFVVIAGAALLAYGCLQLTKH